MESLTHGYDVRTLPFENPTTPKNPSQKPGHNPLPVPTIPRFLEDGLSEMPRMSSQSDPRSSGSSYTGGDKPKPIQEPPVPPKRAKFTNTPLSPPVCQVLGCDKDLSSSKDYHKKHKVCEVHSKTGVVIVCGKEQRFCQQCSRFHELTEFDEGKRSCRKRLAGHNERRRKPQLDSYFGSSYFSTNASKTSSIFPSAFPHGFYHPQCNNNKPKCNNNNNSLGFRQSPRNPIPMISNLPGKESPTKRGLNNTPWPVQEASVGSTNSGCALSLLSSRLNDLPNDSLSENVTPVGFCPEGSRQTVSLVELSIYLQRVEQQKYYEKFCL